MRSVIMKINYPDKIITHTSASSIHTTVADIDSWHKERWNGFTSNVYKNSKGEYYHVGYHFVIDWQGTVKQTRGMNEEGAHCIGQNTSSIGVCFIGNGDHHEPSEAQITAWRTLFRHIQNSYPFITPNDIYPHRKWANKTCHGKILSDTFYAEKLVSNEELKKKLLTEILALYNRLYAVMKNERMKG